MRKLNLTTVSELLNSGQTGGGFSWTKHLEERKKRYEEMPFSDKVAIFDSAIRFCTEDDRLESVPQHINNIISLYMKKIIKDHCE